MQENFEKIFERILVKEGGYVNHPADNGKATNMGVTQKVYNEYLAASGQKPVSVKFITRQQARAIFNVKYWMAIKGDRLPAGWDQAIADMAFNSGPGRAVKLAQLTLGLDDPDGVVGPITIAAIQKAGVEKLNEYMDRRLAYLKTLEDWPVFGKGWAARVAEVKGVVARDFLRAHAIR